MTSFRSQTSIEATSSGATSSSSQLLQQEGWPLPDALVEAGLATSKGQARKDIQGGGANINNAREQDPKRCLKPQDLLFDRHVLLRKGKKHYAVLTFK